MLETVILTIGGQIKVKQERREYTSLRDALLYLSVFRFVFSDFYVCFTTHLLVYVEKEFSMISFIIKSKALGMSDVSTLFTISKNAVRLLMFSTITITTSCKVFPHIYP